MDTLRIEELQEAMAELFQSFIKVFHEQDEAKKVNFLYRCPCGYLMQVCCILRLRILAFTCVTKIGWTEVSSCVLLNPSKPGIAEWNVPFHKMVFISCFFQNLPCREIAVFTQIW